MAAPYDGKLFINGEDVDTLGLRVVDMGAWWSGITVNRSVAQPIGAIGGLPASEATVSPRTLTLAAAWVGTTGSRVSALDDVSWLMEGELEIWHGDDTDRMAKGYLVEDTAVGRFGSGPLADVHGDVLRTFRIVCPNAAKYDRVGRPVGFGSTRTEVPLGTLPSVGVVRILGAATNPTLNYRSTTGEVIQQMRFTITLAADDILSIDLAAETVEKTVSGTTSDALPTLNTADDFFRLDPGHGDGRNAAWPTLDVTAGDGDILYRRAWR